MTTSKMKYEELCEGKDGLEQVFTAVKKVCNKINQKESALWMK